MSRTPLPFHAEDISALARTLKGELGRCDHQPGHVELLNMLARSAGCRNFQHFRAQATAREKLETAPPPPPAVDFVKVRRTARHFDPAGGLVRWPSKFSERQLCLWVLWSRLPSRRVLSEKQINEMLTLEHGFGDPALLRRELVDGGWLTRTRDGAEYRRVERRPPPEALALVNALA
ncbi:MAG TPA: DUF2087 domain-containing protein [Magnetospirillum sp.]|jgi:hypothetical protein|nr:DUF2087 domain-containing protein [Magnetospirillum sp.]